jgi:hypothetical protein
VLVQVFSNADAKDSATSLYYDNHMENMHKKIAECRGGADPG